MDTLQRDQFADMYLLLQNMWNAALVAHEKNLTLKTKNSFGGSICSGKYAEQNNL
jgi:hypothetical protein